MGRIFIPTKISANGKEDIVDMKVYTGSDSTMIDEKICKKLGLKKIGVEFGKGLSGIEKKYNQYQATLEIKGCKPPISFPILGDPKGSNLLGHDILEANNVTIDEKEHRLICPLQFGGFEKV